MQFSSTASLVKRKKADVLVLPYWQGGSAAASIAEISADASAPLRSEDFQGKEGETALLYVENEVEPRLLLLGLGKEEEFTADVLRRAYVKVVEQARKKKWEVLNILLPEVGELSSELFATALADGLLLANYAFDALRSHVLKEEPTFLVKKAVWIGASSKEIQVAKRQAGIFEGVQLTRDLVNRNADEVTPGYLANLVSHWGREYKNIKVTIFDKARIEKEKMGLFLAVNKGSPNPPAFLIVQYRGAPKSKEHTVLIGKGVTYDTGGLNLKPTGYMETMKSDMAGAAAVLGTVAAAATIELEANFTAVVAATENCIGGKSYKPGDVITGYSGKTVEIVNTDAEGRLTLADALSYTCAKLKPTRIIDLATLTGAVVVALGEEISGLMGNDPELLDQLQEAGEETNELLWELPLFAQYRKLLKSEIADMKNCGNRAAGTITAGLFLQDFVEDVPWAHIDIAGTAYHEKALRYGRLHATGFGVRMLIRFLQGQK